VKDPNGNPNERFEDVAALPPGKNLGFKLDEVGLENVQSQVQVQGLLLPARSQACVSLTDVSARGIHMSRLFKILSRLHEQELTWPWLTACLEQMLVSHQSLSDAGFLQVSFELPVLRRALLSGETGWRSYPLTYRSSITRGRRDLGLTAKVLYSSTCPCSESLSRQALSEKFRAQFSEPDVRAADIAAWLESADAVVAVPHSQRSEAVCEFTLDPSNEAPSPLSLIDEIETALGTPVQAAVKREDEQEFARRNAANLMFCEDAARKIKAALLKRDDIADFKIEVRHFESLHSHDVVAKASKND
jgi:GTP cyclohydrolase I